MTWIYSVTPIHVSHDELLRRRERYTRLCPPGVRVHLEDIGPTAPAQLATVDDIAASERAVGEALRRAAEGGWDLLMPDCVLDPGVPTDGANPRMVGALALVTRDLLQRGHRIGAVARNHTIAAELRDRITAAGASSTLAGVAVLDLPLEAIADTGRWHEAVRTAVTGLVEDGATAVLNGCSAVDVVSDDPVDLVDPMSRVLSLLAGERVR